MSLKNLKNRVKFITILLFGITFLTTITYSATSMPTTAQARDGLGFDYIEKNDIDLGETPDTLVARFDSATKTYKLTGSGVLDRERFRNYVAFIAELGNSRNNAEYTLDLSEATMELQSNSSTLFPVAGGSRLGINLKLANLNINKPTNLTGLFLRTEFASANLDVINDWDMSNVTEIRSMFDGTTIGGNPVKPKVTNWVTDNFSLTSLKYYLGFLLKDYNLANLTDTDQRTTLEGKVAALADVDTAKKFRDDVKALNEKMPELIDKRAEADAFIAKNRAKMSATHLEKLETKKAEIPYTGDEATTKISEIDVLLRLIEKVLEAKDYIDSLTNLTPEEKQQFKDRLDAVESEDQIQPIKDEAKASNDSKSDPEKDAAKAYIDSLNNLTDEQKNALKAEIDETDNSQLEAIKSKGSDLNTSMGNLNAEKAKLEALKSNLSDADKALIDTLLAKSDDYNNIDSKEKVDALKAEMETLYNKLKPKKDARDYIDNLPNLTDEQKKALKAKVDAAETTEQIDAIKSEADELNTSMGEMNAAKEKLTNLKNTDTSLTEEEKAEIDNLIAETNPYENIDTKDKVDVLTDRLNALFNRLNVKNAAKEYIDGLENLTQEQKDALKTEVDEATEDQLDAIKAKADELNTSMGDLKVEKDKLAGLKDSNLSDEDKAKIDALLEKAGNYEDIKDKSKVEETTKELQDLYDKLNAKKIAKEYIDGLENLTEDQKDALKAEVDAAETADQLDAIKAKGDELNTSMGNLKVEKDKLAGLKDTNLSDEDEAKIDALLEKAENYENIQDKAKVEETTRELQELYNKLNSKKELKEYIDGLENLTQEQKDALKAEVDAAETADQLNAIRTKANELNKSMGNLKAQKDKLAALKDTNLSDEDKAAIDALLAETEDYSKIENKEAVDKLIKKVENLYNKLNAKNYIDALPHLTEEQKNALKTEMDGAEPDQVETIKVKADKLDESMERLIAKKEEANAVKETEDYKGFSDAEKAELDAVLAKTEKYENIATKEKVEELIKELEILIKKMTRVDLTGYKKYMNVFNYNDTTIVNNFDENTYFNIKFGESVKEIAEALINEGKINSSELIGGINAGVNINVTKDIKLGLFTEYDKRIAHHISFGTNITHKDGLGFIRYRLALFNKLVNHNLDLYGKYRKEISLIDNLTIEPSVGLYVSYSNGVKLDDRVMLKQKVLFYGDLEAKLKYRLDTLEFYFSPVLKFGYNPFVLQDLNIEANKLSEITEYFNYELNAGINNKFSNGIILKTGVNLSGNEKGSFRAKGNVGLGYNW